MNESELIQAARGGDEAAFEQLVRLHEKKIYNLCLRMCGSSEDAAEAAQDTFLALWRGLEGFREDAALSTWLYRLASNAPDIIETDYPSEFIGLPWSRKEIHSLQDKAIKSMRTARPRR